MMHFQRYIRTLTLCVLLFLYGCKTDSLSEPSKDPASLATPIAVVTPTETISIDVFIVPSQMGHNIELKAGQIFKIESPSKDKKWQMDYDPDLFELLVMEDLQLSGSTGWVFKAVNRGNGQIVLTTVEDCTSPPCPLMPARLQIDLQVK